MHIINDELNYFKVFIMHDMKITKYIQCIRNNSIYILSNLQDILK